MCISEIARFAQIKGLSLVGTGDFTHPQWLKEIKDPEAPVLSSCAKVFAGEYTTLISSLALQVYGGHGYIRGNPIERLYRDAKLGDIIEGTTETQRMAIAKDVLEKFAK